jgi:hypothetical protein
VAVRGGLGFRPAVRKEKTRHGDMGKSTGKTTNKDKWRRSRKGK